MNSTCGMSFYRACGTREEKPSTLLADVLINLSRPRCAGRGTGENFRCQQKERMEIALGAPSMHMGRQIVCFPSNMMSSSQWGCEKAMMPNMTERLTRSKIVALSGSRLAHQLWRPANSLARCRKGSLAVRAYGETEGSPAKEPPTIVLRRLLNTPGVHQGPACYDALSAKLVETAGFDLAFISGFAVSAVKLASPDAGLISYGEMAEQARQVTAAVSIPVIGDGDNGYGNALNVKRTVKGYAQAGLAGIIIEDQVSPKACGHTSGRKVVSREEAVAKVRAAVDARIEANSDIVIVARTDARQAVSLDEALWRINAFADAGADVLFIDALTSKEEMFAFCKVASGVPKMASMLEGGGKTPILAPFELEQIGFKLVAYPLSLVGVSIRAMQDALKAIKSGRLPPPGDLPKFDEIKEIVGFSKYYAEDEYYSAIAQGVSANAYGTDTAPSAPPVPTYGRDYQEPTSTYPNFDPAAAHYGAGWRSGADWKSPQAEYVTPDVVEPEVPEKGGFKSTLERLWSRKLRVKVTSSTGSVKLDIRIPAGFLDGLASTVPGVAGLNLRAMLDEAAVKSKGDLQSGQQLIDITDRRGERFQVFLE